jgi:signal transduction histidine kinase
VTSTGLGRRRPSVRTVLLVWLVGLTALGLLVSAVVSLLVQIDGVRDRTDAALRQEVEELRQFAADGVDPQTGARFASLDRLLFVTLQRNVPSENETFLAFIDGAVRYVPTTDQPLRLEDDERFVARLAELAQQTTVVLGSDEVFDRSVRFAAVPVRVDGDPATGLYVVAFDLDAERADALDLLRTSLLVDVASLVLVALVAWAVAGRLLRPVRLLRETAQRISDTGLSERIPVSGSDELSELARTFNAMLERLEQAFDEQRQFMDDAGHELRTPITILRGHLELLDPADPREVEETRALLLDELDRTSRLVEDLALLATSRRPDFSAPAPLDVGSLVRGALEKARGLADRRWVLDEAPDVDAVLDGQRIEQALLQLASNAVRHTAPGGVVAMGAAASAGTLRIWVRDDGEGIAEQDHERVFDRFGRATAGRGHEGSGLGLAIVRAIAESAGGRVRLDSRRGQGARFTLELPWTAPRALVRAGEDGGRG